MKRYYKTYFDTATSAPVEGYFADMKNELRSGQSLMSVDRFVASHLNSIEGTLKIAKTNRIISTEKKIFDLSVDKCDFNNSSGEKCFDNGDKFEYDFHNKNDELGDSNHDDNGFFGKFGENNFDDGHKSEYDFHNQNDELGDYNDDDNGFVGKFGEKNVDDSYKFEYNFHNMNDELGDSNDENSDSFRKSGEKNVDDGDEFENNLFSIDGEKNQFKDVDEFEKDFISINDNKCESESSESGSEYINANIKATENWKNKGENSIKDIGKSKKKRSTKYKDGCDDIRRISFVIKHAK